MICIILSNVIFANPKLKDRVILSLGKSFTSNDFYTVNTIADMHFDMGLGWRLDAVYEHEVYPNIFVFGGAGVMWHSQHIDINQHHRDPTVSMSANLYDSEHHTRSYLSLSGGGMVKIDESLNQKLQVYLPLGMYNMLGISRRYATDAQTTTQNLNFQSWFWGIYSGFIIDYSMSKNTSVRLAPTFTQFFTQYPHYTGSQHSFDVSVGVVFGF
ncbi:MAG: hypothetical protein LAT54_10320 [Cryomorphaceae bacterium]|nr:hypothetical protein [Cryomorphaceae bacterium]